MTLEKLHIDSSRLSIRNLNENDLEDFHLYRSNPEIVKYQEFDIMSVHQALEFIKDQKEKLFGRSGEWIQFAIEKKECKKIIGDCAIRLDLPNLSAEIGITISHLYHKNGFAKETMLAIMKFLFEIKKLHRIVETVDADNEASIRLLRSLNFRLEGQFIENIFFKGNWGSELQFAMLANEWKKQ